jgi:hypothetical protein
MALTNLEKTGAIVQWIYGHQQKGGATREQPNQTAKPCQT